MPETDEQATSHPRPPMANTIPPPEKFSGANSPQQSDLWQKWLRRFERYRLASGLKHKPDIEQVSTLLYSMGECADDILQTINIDEEKATYEEVKTALNKYYEVRRNVLVERAKFNKRVQQQGESIDTFIQDLYKLADDCEYGTLKKELIRDRIIVGVIDDTLSDRLQAKTKLTLEETVQLSRQAEARKQSKEVVRGNTQPSTGNNTVNYIKRPTQNNRPNPRNEAKGETKQSKKTAPPSSCCPWCGNRQRHDRKQCPAKDAACLKCKKRGHFQSVCRSQSNPKPKVNEIEDDDSDMPFLGEVLGEIKGGENSWIVQVGINNVTRCKLDTGAAVSVVSDSLPWIKQQPLEPVRQSLMGPGGTRLTVVGSFLATIKYRQSKIQERVYVIKNQSCSLLSRQACVNLGLIRRLDVEVEELNTEAPNFRAEFPQLFTGLGKLQTECHITLQDDTKPFCLYIWKAMTVFVGYFFS
ncbi:uncharacterized protein LOC116307918 [Actinia tenebrosa]|uniref:Uncharacterized protein LOC116307918 n=1 Tax=Actinia tenebrosa TaxID=6105 RepID=A0A6P8J3C3_ACTTE|nr:uncharacterized protein LOC116307918 [Actinia tenebrosa]